MYPFLRSAKDLKFILEGDFLHLFTASLRLAATKLHVVLHRGLEGGLIF